MPYTVVEYSDSILRLPRMLFIAQNDEYFTSDDARDEETSDDLIHHLGSGFVGIE